MLLMQMALKNEAHMYEALAKALEERAWAEVPFSLPRERLAEGARVFFRYLDIPQEEKEKLLFFDRPENRQGIGYVKRTSDRAYGDDKEFFHYHPKLLKEFAGNPLIERKETAEFLVIADEIYKEATNRMKDILHILETKYEGIYARMFPTTEDYIEYSALRFLKYEPGGVGSFLANAHYDRGCMTLALSESAPGLRIGKGAESLEEVVHKENTAVFMPAFQFRELTNGDFLPAWHDVVQKSEDLYRKDAARWAIVFFADTPDLRVPTRDECHTPLG
jgi:isopenicillin N synthase-like dioxygenase